jgi:hypothetical protein
MKIEEAIGLAGLVGLAVIGILKESHREERKRTESFGMLPIDWFDYRLLDNHGFTRILIDENGKAEYYRRQSQYFGWSLSEKFIPNRDLPKFVQIELKGDLRSGLLDATVITKSGMKMTGTVVVYKK